MATSRSVLDKNKIGMLDTQPAFAYNKHLPSLVAQLAERAAVNC